ncbi:uncharacterized protein LOC113491644 [Trichoplusia ni]|uniref:Uncharacterized protein LOC113491644 n=1 Tax=Trichoplusia ni TaxID=7111 RepID=A0A7E5V8A4_TRINI|nr:uncharacterized protein LOC113491644 [Trichoplusia ni]
MAFSLRKMFSNISYFSKSGDHTSPDGDITGSPQRRYVIREASENIEIHPTEPDSTSKHLASSLKLPESVKKFAAKKGSLSDTDLLTINDESKSRSRKPKSLKLDIKKASQSMTDCFTQTDRSYVENTPKHILLECKSADLFSEKFKSLNFSRSFEFDLSSDSEQELDIESLSECSDTDLSVKEEETSEIKMCRKVESSCETEIVPSVTPESFGDVELDRSEEQRMELLFNYEMRFERVELVLKKLLSEFQFHIDVCKLFNERFVVTARPGTDVASIPSKYGQVHCINNVNRDTPTEYWNIVMQKEDNYAKQKFRSVIESIQQQLLTFYKDCLEIPKPQKVKKPIKRSTTFDLHKGKRMHKSIKVSNKKRIKHFDFPDYREAFLNLFNMETDETDTKLNQSDVDKSCVCQCHLSLNQSDSGLTTKTENSNQSITSSIGNFSLDSTTLSAYSESLDMIVSYNSFDDSSLFTTLLQKPAIERITFYVQVHSIQLKPEITESFDGRNSIKFYCPACETTDNEEDGLLKHILNQKHCEKIHFLYKTAYIKKCVMAGKEIQPSTVLNPMTMYRDDNKIVCFGDAMYACSLCFENLIIGESILMAHCAEPVHLQRREKLYEIFE